MDISPLSSSAGFTLSTASQLQAGQVQAELAAAVLKSILDQQAQQAQALLQMMGQQPSLDGTGKIVNLAV
jgi:hypothetical protein